VISRILRVLPRTLVPQFALLSGIAILILGVALGAYLNILIRDHAESNAVQSARVLAGIGIQPLISQSDLQTGLTPDRVAALDSAVNSSKLLGTELARINIWNPEHRVVYSNDHSLIWKVFPSSDELDDALNGTSHSGVSTPSKAENESLISFGQILEVYVPLRLQGSSKADGAFEIYIPYRPIAAGILRDELSVFGVLTLGLLLLYALLFRIVTQTARRLGRQAEELKRQTAEREYAAHHDVLTLLPNRTLFQQRLREAIAVSGKSGAVMIMDLDRFQEINDTLGHHNGDSVLIAVAKRLAAASDSRLVARLGGDEFAVLLEAVNDRKEAVRFAERLLATLADQVTLGDLTLDVRGSIGVALFPEHGTDADSLMQRADIAMYVAKGNKRGYEVYSPQSDRYAPERLALIADLHRALNGTGLFLTYQPKIDLKRGRISGVEALIRWQHPTRGLIQPDDFIPLAEHTGLIKDLTLWVLDTALAQSQAWQREGIELGIAVNLSVRNLLDLDLPDQVARLLQKWDVPAHQLELEITETTLMEDPARASSVIARLHAMGIRLSIDDFGTGYSSLVFLKQLPVQEIKIDKSFVLNMLADLGDGAIVRSIIDLAKNLGLDVVAEGVESEGIMQELTLRGCTTAQGFFISRPVRADRLSEWLVDSSYAEPKAA
jgi:diguanylate cyclase (GGDEF)-like protein